ncbi:hypothetical protein EGW08_005981 [Elysia chlorotica]|uniref:Uncharacterized protein n=1 Tax=Elysia chlorotica TaxID=188477 RepID=A0A433TXC1_ELYCH|nr:hypothetical protein EGW08_005981 [Elysia chlorotica]
MLSRTCFVALLSVMIVYVAYAWMFERRKFTCSATNEECTREAGCCNPRDVCVMLRDEVLDEETSVSPTRCTTIHRRSNQLESKRSCDDSRQCKESCCRVYRGYRYGVMTRCGRQKDEYPPRTYDCVVRHF